MLFGVVFMEKNAKKKMHQWENSLTSYLHNGRTSEHNSNRLETYSTGLQLSFLTIFGHWSCDNLPNTHQMGPERYNLFFFFKSSDISFLEYIDDPENIIQQYWPLFPFFSDIFPTAIHVLMLHNHSVLHPGGILHLLAEENELLCSKCF